VAADCSFRRAGYFIERFLDSRQKQLRVEPVDREERQ